MLREKNYGFVDYSICNSFVDEALIKRLESKLSEKKQKRDLVTKFETDPIPFIHNTSTTT